MSENNPRTYGPQENDRMSKECESTDARSSLAAPADSDFSVDDAINGLRHMADDHECCKPFIVATISKLEQLREAVNTAIWIRDRIQDKGGFGAGFEEWRDIEAASG